MRQQKSNDWPVVVLILGILAFIGILVLAGHPEALWGLFFLVLVFFL